MTSTLPGREAVAERRPRPWRVLSLAGGALSLRWTLRPLVVGLALAAGVVVVAVWSITTGDYPLPLADVVRTLLGGGTSATEFIVETLRLPRVLTALMVGGCLGLAGFVFQSLSRNPLGSPDVVGFDNGAALGGLVAILFLSAGTAGTAAGAVVGGLTTAGAIYLLSYSRGVQSYRLILIGIGVSSALVSVNSFLLTRSSVDRALSAQVWLVGSLNGRGWEHVRPVAVAFAVLLPIGIVLSRKLRMLEMGDDAAKALGVRVERARLGLLVLAVAATAVAVASAGPIRFVALAAPQIARRLTRSQGAGVLPAVLMGGLVLAVADLVAQHLLATALPVGVLTGAVGGLYLMWLLASEWRKGRS
ncbi:FecCD family ABC transporter permease [Motilibacter aurantiacus]|uniref:FecCD family ABC transporter permease n=1 Tax=Motilibacter aurantiacus TaxID=2714955 RepID=UPI00140AA319|nr:iron chelate uptake ABC transporter family permease subunit [Motilibacter aurantiacus]